MKNKEIILISGGLLTAMAFYWFVIRKSDKKNVVTKPVKPVSPVKNNTKVGEASFRDGLLRLRKEFGLTQQEAELLEQQFRLETAHFKSGQFKESLSPGMEKFGATFPYGWTSLNNFIWKMHPEYAPNGSSKHKENATGKVKSYLNFPTLYASMVTVLHNARMNDGNFYAWFSNNSDSQLKYKKRMDRIIPRIAREGVKSGIS